jgi:CRP/FNR family cyclic AMP-dependent transcriptional regulator
MHGDVWHNDSDMAQHNVLERRFYPKGKIIVKEGEEAFVAFIIQSGIVSVFSEKDGKKVEFSKLKTGDIFGETSLIMNAPRSASVEAIEDCNMIVIRRDDFEKKLTKSDATIKAVVEMLSKRILNSNAEMIKSKGVNIDSFISLLNQLFRDLLQAMPDEDKGDFKEQAFPVLGDLIKVIEKYRDKL